MQISQAAWSNYVARLSALNQKAGQAMAGYIKTHGTGDTEALTRYAWALVTKYGEGSAELACQMYEAIAEAEGVRIPAAQPAETAGYDEVARMVQGTKDSPPEMQSGVSRMVKRTGADTVLKNAIRDGAEFAWVPHGDSCAFCITLASRGWQRASKKALKNGHAEHIHAHCDCEYAVRFGRESSVKGYDPDEYWQRYQAAGGDINAMRRENYAANRDKINAQKRAAWAARKAQMFRQTLYLEPQPVTMKSIQNIQSFACNTLDQVGQNQLKNAHKRLLMTASSQPAGTEVGRTFDLSMNPLTQNLIGSKSGNSVVIPDQAVPYIAIHTHPDCNIFSQADLRQFAQRDNLKLLTAIGHDGHIYAIEKLPDYAQADCMKMVNSLWPKLKDLKDKPISVLSNEQFIEKADGLIRATIKEMEKHGTKFYE